MKSANQSDVEDMKSPKEDYEIRKSVVSDPGTGEDLLNFLSFYTLVIYHVIISISNKCTSKVVTPDNKRTMAENLVGKLNNWTRITISSLNLLSTNSLFLHPTISYLGGTSVEEEIPERGL
jgi:hypothetical protein